MQTRNCTLCKKKEYVSNMSQYRSRWFCKVVKRGNDKSCLEKVKNQTRGTI